MIEFLNEVGSKNALYAKTELNSAFLVARDIAFSFKALQQTQAANRPAMNAVMRNLLESNPNLLATWTAGKRMHLMVMTHPGVSRGQEHDATGRFVPYWFRGAGGSLNVEPLIGYDVPGDGDYYLLAQRSGKEPILEPYVYAVGGVDTLITTMVVPINTPAGTIGVGGIDLSLADIQEQLSAIRPMGTGYLTLTTGSGNIGFPPKQQSNW